MLRRPGDAQFVRKVPIQDDAIFDLIVTVNLATRGGYLLCDTARFETLARFESCPRSTGTGGRGYSLTDRIESVGRLKKAQKRVNMIQWYLQVVKAAQDEVDYTALKGGAQQARQQCSHLRARWRSWR